MKIIVRGLLIIACALFTVQCATYYNLFGSKSKLLTHKEMEIHKKTTSILGYIYGFDTKRNIDYVVYFKHSKKVKKIKNSLLSYLKGIDKTVLKIYYEKIYRLKAITSYRKYDYRQKKDWSNYTYFNEYLLPPLESYLKKIEKQIASLNKKYAVASIP